jgi:manganese/zinc/iron transport system ATP- binding protein
MNAVIGPNGAGKSTLLKAALGLVARQSGAVTFAGAQLATMRDRIAYVPQRAAVDWDFPATATDVVLMGLYRRLGFLRFVGRRERAEAAQCLAEVGLADLAHRQIGQLSGGQQQRVFIARALAQQADILILDEPLAGVDAPTERTIVSVLRERVAQGGTVIAVHHDLATAGTYFDHALVLNRVTVFNGPIGEALHADVLDAAYGTHLMRAGGAFPEILAR